MEDYIRKAAKRVTMRLVYGSLYYVGRWQRDGGVTILSYHSIDDFETDLSVSASLFRKHMRILAGEGCRTLTMREVAAHLRADKPFPPRSIAITFDDGFESVALHAAPVMRWYGFTGTVYPITGMVGRATQWRAFGRQLPSLRLLSWPQVRDLASAGWEIGAHSVRHGFLTRCSHEELCHELVDSRVRLEEAVGEPVVSFAYPQGDYNRAVAKTTREAGYLSAVTVDQGRARLGDDPFRLPRLFVGRNTSPAVFKAFTAPSIRPAYALINFLMNDLGGHGTWPRPDPDQVDSTGYYPVGASSAGETEP